MVRSIEILLVVLLVSGCGVEPDAARTIACFKLKDGGKGCGIVTNEGGVYTWTTR